MQPHLPKLGTSIIKFEVIQMTAWPSKGLIIPNKYRVIED